MSSAQHRAVDIVVPFGPTTATRPGLITITVRTLLLTKSLGKLVVIANGALHESSEKELNSLTACSPKIEVLRIPTANLSAARNLGAKSGSSDYILFCDADTLALPDTIESMLRLASPSVFVTGARRRYIPLTIDVGLLDAIVAKGNWIALDSIATEQPAQYPSDGYANIAPPLVMRYTLIGAFGVIHRALFEKVGGFDVDYQGWGLEDVDLIRRLLRKAGCHLVGRTCAVWHIDHYIEPYRTANHWLKNWNTYVSKVDVFGMLLTTQLMRRELWNRCDTRVLLQPTKRRIRRSRIDSLRLAPRYRNALYKAVENQMKDPDICAVLLYGSARYKRMPKDIDLVTLLLSAKVHDHRCSQEDSVLIEQKRVSLVDLEDRIGHPGRNPDAWLFVLSRFDSRWLLGTRLNIGKYLDSLRNRAIRRFAYHLITYHVGNLRVLSNRESNPTPSVAMHLACIVGPARGTCPDLYKPPFFSNPRLALILQNKLRLLKTGGKDALPRVLYKDLTALVEHYGLSNGVGKAYYPASQEGRKALISWGIEVAPLEWEG